MLDTLPHYYLLRSSDIFIRIFPPLDPHCTTVFFHLSRPDLFHASSVR